MKPISKRTPVTVGILIAACTAAWKAAHIDSDVQYLKASFAEQKQEFAEVKADVKTLLKRTAEVATCPRLNTGPYSTTERPVHREERKYGLVD